MRGSLWRDGSHGNGISIHDSVVGICKRDDTLGHCLQRERALEISDEAKPESHRCSSSRNSVFDDDARSEDTLDIRRGQSACKQKE
jgi:hypothetical protein